MVTHTTSDSSPHYQSYKLPVGSRSITSDTSSACNAPDIEEGASVNEACSDRMESMPTIHGKESWPEASATGAVAESANGGHVDATATIGTLSGSKCLEDEKMEDSSSRTTTPVSTPSGAWRESLSSTSDAPSPRSSTPTPSTHSMAPGHEFIPRIFEDSLSRHINAAEVVFASASGSSCPYSQEDQHWLDVSATSGSKSSTAAATCNLHERFVNGQATTPAISIPNCAWRELPSLPTSHNRLPNGPLFSSEGDAPSLLTSDTRRLTRMCDKISKAIGTLATAEVNKVETNENHMVSMPQGVMWELSSDASAGGAVAESVLGDVGTEVTVGSFFGANTGATNPERKHFKAAYSRLAVSRPSVACRVLAPSANAASREQSAPCRKIACTKQRASCSLSRAVAVEASPEMLEITFKNFRQTPVQQLQSPRGRCQRSDGNRSPVQFDERIEGVPKCQIKDTRYPMAFSAGFA